MNNMNIQGKCPFHAQESTFGSSLLIPEEIVNLKSVTGPLPASMEEYRDSLLAFKEWVLNIVSKPHPDLGRPGDICPATQESYEKNLFWVTVQPLEQHSFEDIKNIILHFKGIFSHLISKSTNKALTTIAIILPDLIPQYYWAVDAMHQCLKPDFVRDGFMLGEFYPRCPQPGIHNKDFRPLDAPVPNLVIRNMLKSDIQFLKGNPQLEAWYLQLFPQTNKNFF
jgi:hypothetical protein